MAGGQTQPNGGWLETKGNKGSISRRKASFPACLREKCRPHVSLEVVLVSGLIVSGYTAKLPQHHKKALQE